MIVFVDKRYGSVFPFNERKIDADKRVFYNNLMKYFTLQGVSMYKKKTLSLKDYNSLTLNIGELTDSENRLNDYIKVHFNELPYHGIVDLSQNATVSKATIGRFLNKIGFTGYSAFKKALDISLLENKMASPYEQKIKQRCKTEITTESSVGEFTQKSIS
ncbi:MurR/RpiR family transcriptional regulator, partial [Shigella dysenteriae]